MPVWQFAKVPLLEHGKYLCRFTGYHDGTLNRVLPPKLRVHAMMEMSSVPMLSYVHKALGIRPSQHCTCIFSVHDPQVGLLTKSPLFLRFSGMRHPDHSLQCISPGKIAVGPRVLPGISNVLG